jgi:hypothetical protein
MRNRAKSPALDTSDLRSAFNSATCCCSFGRSALKITSPFDVATRQIVLDLKDLTLVDRDVVSFLKSCEADTIKLKNCPAYVR